MRVLLFIAAFLMSVSCGTHAAENPTLTADPDSGVRGKTTIGPACPSQSQDRPCLDMPIDAAVTVMRPSSETVIATVHSDNDGIFKLTLPPGQYHLAADLADGPRIYGAKVQDVTVEAGTWTRVVIRFDSGVR